jgi:hypothetical protein
MSASLADRDMPLPRHRVPDRLTPNDRKLVQRFINRLLKDRDRDEDDDGTRKRNSRYGAVATTRTQRYTGSARSTAEGREAMERTVRQQLALGTYQPPAGHVPRVRGEVIATVTVPIVAVDYRNTCRHLTDYLASADCRRSQRT